MQYTPLPHAAVDLLGADPAELALLYGLYRSAHGERWGWLRGTEAELTDRHGLSARAVKRILAGLVAAGLAEREIVTSGRRREGTRLRLLDPATEAEAPLARADHQRIMNGSSLGRSNADKIEAPDHQRITNGSSTTDLNSAENDLTIPPSPPAGGRSRQGAVRWVADRALRELDELADAGSGLALFDLAPSALVDRWIDLVRPERETVRRAGQQSLVVHRQAPDAPDGLRRREISDGLRAAAARWRAGERPGLEPRPSPPLLACVSRPEVVALVEIGYTPEEAERIAGVNAQNHGESR